MIKPIPLNLLIHEVLYEEYLEDDRYGETYAAPVKITNVRVEPVLSQQQRSSATVRETSSDQYILFFDMTHSRPKVNFKEKSKITLNDQVYIVSKVSEVHAFSNVPHHIEVFVS